MRNALTGDLIVNMPLDAKFMERFGQPYGVTHCADDPRRIPEGLSGQQPDHAPKPAGASTLSRITVTTSA